MTEKELDELIKRINELAHKSKTAGLTPEEKEEQAKLRQAYLANFRKTFRSQLNNIDIKEADGTIVNLGEKYDKKNN